MKPDSTEILLGYIAHNISYDFCVIQKFKMAAKPIMLSDLMKFQISSSQLPHVCWNCYMVGMSHLRPSNYDFVILLIVNPRWPPPENRVITKYPIWKTFQNSSFKPQPFKSKNWLECLLDRSLQNVYFCVDLKYNMATITGHSVNKKLVAYGITKKIFLDTRNLIESKHNKWIIIGWSLIPF